MKFFLFLALFIVLTFGGGKKSTKGGKVSSGKSKGGASSNKKSSESSKSKGSGGGGGGGSSSYVPTDYIPSNDELCGCFELDLVCTPTVINDEICYYYLMTKISDDDYCQVIITDLTLGTDNNCGLTSTDIDSYLLDYAPKCYNIDPLSVDGGINIKLDSIPSGSSKSDSSSKSGTKSGTKSATKSGGSSSSKTGTKSGTKSGGGGSSSSSSKTNTKTSTKTGSQSGSKKGGASSGYGSSNKSGGSSSGGGGSGGSSGPSISQDDYIIFSMCFDASKVAGFQSTGQIGYNTGSGSYTCDVYNVLPNFCGTPEPTTASPTSAAPTTSSPTTASPTTADPTTADPTTASPTTSNPTTANPTTVEPTTAEPTTAEPTTAEPTTVEPTTAEPTTAEPTTAQPTTSEPTTSEPTMAPTYDECNSSYPYNIAFLLDESGSISDEEWPTIINFVERIYDFDVSQDSYVSLHEFASLPGFQTYLDFTGPKSNAGTVTDVTDALDLMEAQYTKAGQTETWDAVNRVLDHFYDWLDGSTPNQMRDNVLFLITDGNPTDDAGNPNKSGFISLNYNTCDYIQRRLESQFPDNYIDIVILVIDPSGDVDISKIDCLDYYDNGADIIRVESFDSSAFTDIESRFREKICRNGSRPQEGPLLEQPEWEYCLNDTDPNDCMVGLGPVPDADGGGVTCVRDNGAPPCAIDDAFTVTIAQTIAVNVLDNDIDNIGSGLSINDVTSGSCTISNNQQQLEYTCANSPGTDTCEYNVIDGNGGNPQVSLTSAVVTFTCQ